MELVDVFFWLTGALVWAAVAVVLLLTGLHWLLNRFDPAWEDEWENGPGPKLW